MITVYAGKKGNGKTTRLLEWLFGGQRVEGYPGWDRVVIVPDRRDLENLKDAFRVHACAIAEVGDVSTPEWRQLDFDHRCFCAHEWRDAVNARETTEIAIDGLDELPVPLDHLRGTLTLYSLNRNAEPRDPENGMTISEANEHAAAHDGRYRRIRDAVKRVKDEPHSGTALNELYMIAADYDWAHPGDEILGLPEEDSTGVAGYGETLSREHFIEQLEWLVGLLKADDSMEGSLAYETTGDGVRVQGAIRYGNSMGQGAVRLYRKDLP